jgi:hypothetical protein
MGFRRTFFILTVSIASFDLGLEVPLLLCMKFILR